MRQVPRSDDPPSMPRQIITLRLDGITAADYIAHMTDPEPPALGAGLRSVTLRAEPTGAVVTALLDWQDCVPAPRVAAVAAGLPVTAEVVEVEGADVEDPPAERRRASVLDRAAERLAGRPWSPSIPPPLQLRWA